VKPRSCGSSWASIGSSGARGGAWTLHAQGFVPIAILEDAEGAWRTILLTRGEVSRLVLGEGAGR
jgi:hypothetical protein